MLQDFKFVVKNVVGIREGWEDFVALFGGLAVRDKDGNDEEYFVTWREAFRDKIVEHVKTDYELFNLLKVSWQPGVSVSRFLNKVYRYLFFLSICV